MQAAAAKRDILANCNSNYSYCRGTTVMSIQSSLFTNYKKLKANAILCV